MFLGTYRLYRTDNAEAPSAGDVTWTPISGDLTSGCTGAAPNGARGCLISRDRRRRRRRRRLRRHRRRLDPGQPGRGHVATPRRWHRVGAGSAAEPAGQPDRRRPVELADRLRGVRRLRGGDAGQPRPRLRHHRRRPALAATSPATCRTSRSTRVVVDPSDAKTIYVGTDVGAVRDRPTAAHVVRALGSGDAEGRRLAARLRRHATASSPPAPTAAAPTPCRTATPRRRSWSRRPTPASRSARAARSTTRSRCKNIGNAAATGVTVTDPVPAAHVLRVGGQRSGGHVGQRRCTGRR